MNNRLLQFLKAENISQSIFADTLGVARASVSHIIAGRNKPGFDFIESMARHYPSINLEWLITGKGKMYKAAMKAENPAAEMPFEGTDDLFSSLKETASTLPENPDPVRKPAVQPEKLILSETSSQGRRIAKIVVFFDDNTFQELK